MNICSPYNRKKYQRAVNKLIRAVNKSISDDWVWDGRFTISQIAAYFRPYADHSGAHFIVKLKCTDNKTGRTETEWFDNYSFDWQLWEWVNKCIIEYFDVWREIPNPKLASKGENANENDYDG